jgi:protease IV
VIAWIVWAVRLAVWWLRDGLRRTRRPPARVAFLLEEPPPELDAPRPPLWQRFLARRPPSIQALTRQLRAVAAEPRVRSVVLHLRPMDLTAAQVESLRDAIGVARGAGARLTCWAPSYNAATYCVACAADEVLIQPGGMVGPLGLVREHVFLTDALDRIGVRVDLLQVSPFKTAGDPLTRHGLTPEAREMSGWLADAALADRLAAIASGRSMDDAAALALVDATPLTDEQAVAAGAVDAAVDEEDLPARLGGEVRSWGAARRRLPRPRPPRPGRVVALLRIEGMIVDGRSRRAPIRPPLAPPLLFEDQCGDLTVVEQARSLAVDRRVAAVVLWVDSPGGSASASESMAAALAMVAKRKPVVAVMGSVAASGGYYVVTPAARVFARSGTITGSIGVLAGKLVAGGLLDLLLVRRELIVRGQHAPMWGIDSPFTEPERRKMEEFIRRSYGLFLERVAAGRRRPVAEIEQVAGGRVWTGRQALGHGLVDDLGGLPAGLAEARRLAGLPDDAPLREARRGRRDLAVPGTQAPLGLGGAGTTLATLEHALRAVAALRQAGAWWLCPLVSEGER